MGHYASQTQLKQMAQKINSDFARTAQIQDGTIIADKASHDANGNEIDISTLANDFAKSYSNTTAYKIGNLLTYLGKQYYCIADAPAGTLPTNTTYFEEKSVADIIEMIKNGSIVVGHSDVADNLTPYSEDSGTTQENPFISQGTGTDNNSVIVTTGTIARQLEKQGNTVVVNQQARDISQAHYTAASCGSFTFATNKFTFVANAQYGGLYQDAGKLSIVAGHTYIAFATIKTTTATDKIRLQLDNASVFSNATTNAQKLVLKKVASTTGSTFGMLQIGDTRTSDWDSVEVSDVKVIDLTQWFNGNDNIPADLTSHPEHFSWYYNGSMSYDAGSLQNCNGRYLECGQGRNLFDQEWEQGAYNTDTGAKESSTFKIRSKNRYLVTPLLSYYFWQNTVNTGTFRVFQYDKDGNYLGNIAITARGTFTVVANCRWITFQCADSYGTTYNNDISIELYYTPEQGGEGYGEMHDYIAPIRIDTGDETLKAFDKKLPSGVIERNTGEVDLGDLTWAYTEPSTGYPYGRFAATVAGKAHGTKNILCAKYVTVNRETSLYSDDKSIVGRADTSTVYVIDSAYTDVATFKTAMSGVMIQYELNDANKTTEQGTPFSEYAPINDYSYMAWFDTDGNLVSIPQGCKLFYPVDYKGFVDDLVMYTNGDATALAKGEDITDSALNARGYYKMQDLLTTFAMVSMVGDTLRHILANKLNIDFNNTAYIVANETTWYYQSGADYLCYGAFVDGKKAGVANVLCSKYQTGTIYQTQTDMICAGNASNTLVYIRDNSYSSQTKFNDDMAYVIIAYEKA